MGYLPTDEWPHVPEDPKEWQESAYACWYDAKAGLAGFHRIGHQMETQTAMVWCGIVAADGTRFRRVDANIPLSAADREGGFGAGRGQFIRVGEGGPTIEVDEPDLEIRLKGNDFFPVRDLWKEDNVAMFENVAKGHFEAGGRFTGHVRLGDRRYEIDAIGYRDRSWGVRRWDYLTSHRWCGGTFGPALSWSCFTWHAADGAFFTGGFVVRDGKGVAVDHADVVLHLEADGLTYRGGEMNLTLATGERLCIEARTMDGIVFNFRNVWEFEAACTATCGDLTGGFAALEATNNARRGTTAPTLALLGTMQSGLQRAK